MKGLPELVRRFVQDRGVRSALYAFTWSRVLIFSVLILASHLSFEGPPQSLGEFQEPTIPLPLALKEKLEPITQRGDAGWYRGIAVNGYERIPFEATDHHNWAFFPLFPLLWGGLAAWTGHVAITGVLLSNVFFFLALILLYKTAKLLGYDEPQADRAVFLAAIFPVSYFFSVPMTESLFFFLVIGAFWSAKKERWWLAGLLGACASATRFVGVLMLAALIMVAYEQYGKDWKRYRRTIWLMLIPVGLLSFMLYLHSITGDAFAFKDIQVTWGRRLVFFLKPLAAFVVKLDYLASPWDFRLVNFIASIFGLACGALFLKRRQWSLAFIVLALVLTGLSTGTLNGMARYVMVTFPVYFILAEIGQREKINRVIEIGFAALLSLLSAFYAWNFSLAMT